MPNLSPSQIFQYAYRAGFRGVDLLTAVAVALKESGGNIRAYNPESAAGTAPGSGSRGLWQIYGTAHPEFNNDLVYDPQANANAAFKVYREAGNRFTPWSTYNNGSATAMVPSLAGLLKNQRVSIPTPSTVIDSVKQTTTTAITAGPVSSATHALESAGTFFEKISSRNFIEDGLAVAAGMTLIFIGLIALFLMTDTGKDVVKTGAKYAVAAAAL